MNVRDLIPEGNLVRLLAAAAILHLLLVVSIYLAGRWGLWPTTFDANGIGLPFASDCLGYRLEAVSLTEVLTRQGLMAWLTSSSAYLINPLHVKIYSLSFLALGPLLGYNILAAEPLNLIYYLTILYLVVLLGREVFDEGTGLLAARAVALWPSLLLHTTQLFRDPLFIAGVVGLALVCVRSVTRDYSLVKGLRAAACGSLLTVLLWLLRREMWEVVMAILLVTAGLLVIKQLRDRRVLAGSLLTVSLLLVANLSIPRVWGALERRQTQNSASQPAAPQVLRHSPPGSGLQVRIMQLRHGFTTAYPNATSNIDTDVEFRSLSDIVLYLPRAASIGFFAPFPNMWFTPGAEAGLKGRLLTGFETLLMYVVTLLAALSLWYNRGKLSVWLLFLAAGAGLVALGFTVTNVAALYRMRYSYWILLIVLGAEGFRRVFGYVKQNTGVRTQNR
ncbi:MAG: hypothetical protein M3362_03790 [Acidobacteriota bacterium]|nr:hypothetical protein [Acidobacteriota bacterium]